MTDIDIIKNKFNARNKWALVIGDLMLDRYLIGNVSRISPEAPVPVVKLKESFIVLGDLEMLLQIYRSWELKRY